MAKTKSGFEYTVNNPLEDWELFEDLADNSRYGEIKAARRMLGIEQYNKLKDHCRDKDGRVSTTKMETELSEIIEASASKNS